MGSDPSRLVAVTQERIQQLQQIDPSLNDVQARNRLSSLGLSDEETVTLLTQIKEKQDNDSRLPDSEASPPDETGDVQGKNQPYELPEIDAKKLTAKDAGEYAQEAFKLVRDRFKETGIKSSNKRYSPDSDKYSDAQRRLDVAQQTVYQVQQKKRQQHFDKRFGPDYTLAMEAGAGNCGEMAGSAAQIVNKSGGYAEQWFIPGQDHSFTIVGRPPAKPKSDFSNFDGCWVADPWTGIVCEAKDYPKKYVDKMNEWADQKKEVFFYDDKLKKAGWWPANRDLSLESFNSQKKSALYRPDPRLLLATQDRRDGLLTIGATQVARAELYDMGATVNGKKIDVQNINLVQSSQALIDSLQFASADVGRHIQSARPENVGAVATLLFDVASQRSPTAPPVLRGVTKSGAPSPHMMKLDKLLNASQGLKAQTAQVPGSMPSWVDTAKSQSMASVGVGLQAYGFYSGIMSTADAMRKGDWGEAAINVGSIAAEGGTLLVEKGLGKVGEAMIRNGGKIFNSFAATSVGKTLSRGAGLFGSALTLPFDIYSAVKSFEDAANASGKQAQDHYVNAGFSLTSAGLSLALGGAAAAGFSSAGPIGVAAAAVMIMGARIYGAARQVDDIDDYIQLSARERLRSGWFAFTGQTLDEDVTDRYAIAKTTSDYAKAIEKEAKTLLDGELKQSTEAIVNGNFDVGLMPVKHWKFQWDADAGELPYTEVKEPTVRETDDIVNAREGLDETMPGVIVGEKGEGKAVLWQLGGGNDEVTGVRNKPNWFSYGAGKKTLNGGKKDDLFLFQAADAPLKWAPNQPKFLSILRGRAGNDTLSLQGKVNPRADYAYAGYDIDLKKGKLGLRSHSANKAVTSHMKMRSIENVETLQGASSHVTGSDEGNRIVLRGRDDSANAGAGDDIISIEGADATVNGGQGKDRYFIAQGQGTVNIIEDGKEESRIEVGWELEGIQHWRIDGNDLVITSLRGVDGELPGREIRIANVYREENGKRVLQNDKLLVDTQDGYTIKPDLPEQLNDKQPLNVRVVVLVAGQAKPAPTRLSGGEFPISTVHGSYFIERGGAPTTLDVKTSDDAISSTVFLDYDSSEIDKVEASYTVTSRRGGNFNHLTYSGGSVIVHMKDGKQISFKNIADNRSTKGTNVGGSLIASGFKLNHAFILTMNDGTSYRVLPPQHSYFDDHRQPGKRVVDSFASLKLRYGEYMFAAP